jgi:hypothetical protein
MIEDKHWEFKALDRAVVMVEAMGFGRVIELSFFLLAASKRSRGVQLMSLGKPEEVSDVPVFRKTHNGLIIYEFSS